MHLYVLIIATDHQLYEKVLRSHGDILEKIDSFDVRLYLYEKGVIPYDDYNTYFIQDCDARRSLCENMMYLLCKDRTKVERNLQHFMCALRNLSKYADVVDHIGSVDVGKIVVQVFLSDGLFVDWPAANV